MLGGPAAAQPVRYGDTPEDRAYNAVRDMRTGFMQNYRPPATLANSAQVRRNYDAGGTAYREQMNQYGSRDGQPMIPRFGQGVGYDGGGWTAGDIVSGAGMPQQSVDGRYAVNPQGKYAMGGQYFQPGATMAPVQGWRQGVAPSARDMAINDAFQGKKQQYVNTQFSNPQAAYARMAQTRARRMGMPVAGLDAAGVQQMIARGQDMQALRSRGVNTADPRIMKQFAQAGPQGGNPYAMQRLNKVLSGEAPNINQAIEAAVDAGMPPEQIRQQIGGLFGSAAFDTAIQGYGNHTGMFGGVDENKKRIYGYFNPGAGVTAAPGPSGVPAPPAANPPPVAYNPASEGFNSSGDVWGGRSGASPSSTYPSRPRTAVPRGGTYVPPGYRNPPAYPAPPVVPGYSQSTLPPSKSRRRGNYVPG
jgi:hypothetical protein